MARFDNIQANSPVPFQDFVWLAEYYDGREFLEYDPTTKQKNDFNRIERDKLIRFGLIGNMMRLYFEAYGGVFKLQGIMLEFLYRTGGKEYALTGQPVIYKDLIAYKDGGAWIDLIGGNGSQQSSGVEIDQYNFGYKAQIQGDEELRFHFRAICKIPYNQPVYMNLRLVANAECEDGVFIVRRNNKVIAEMPAPLSKEVGGELNWVVG